MKNIPRPSSDNRSSEAGRFAQGIEAVSGLDLSAVRINTNATKPEQAAVHAYAQQNTIHFSQNRSAIPHEMSHVVQQRQQMVKASSTNEKNTGRNG